MKPIYVIGYPGPIGGAATELWHTLKLWRRNDLEVHLVPTWGQPPADFLKLSTAIGCTTHVCESPQGLEAVPGIRGATVIAFCNDYLLQAAAEFRRLECRIVWAGCMNWLFPLERRQYGRLGPFDRYVMQSLYQCATLLPELARYGVRAADCHHIPGWIDVEEYSLAPRPHADGEPFVIGRVSRAAPDKFSSGTWPMFGRVNYAPIRMRVLGWEPACARAIGDPPPNAECLATGAEPVPEFLKTLHCYCQLNGSAVENWPRTALEAMAAGVPIVAEARGGWPEMLEHGRTGFVCRSDAETAHWIAHLAYDEERRQDIIARAYRRLVSRLADPEDCWSRWDRLFESLERT